MTIHLTIQLIFMAFIRWTAIYPMDTAIHPLSNWCHYFKFGWNTTGLSQEQTNSPYSCHGVFIDRVIFRSNFLGMRLPWECHDQSQETKWRYCITGPELRYFHKRKRILKIHHAAEMPWHGSSMEVACSYSSAHGWAYVSSLFPCFPEKPKWGVVV